MAEMIKLPKYGETSIDTICQAMQEKFGKPKPIFKDWIRDGLKIGVRDGYVVIGIYKNKKYEPDGFQGYACDCFNLSCPEIADKILETYRSINKD
jgi:hypothetical protein